MVHLLCGLAFADFQPRHVVKLHEAMRRWRRHHGVE